LVLANQSNTFTASQSVAVNDAVNETVTNMLFLNHTTSAVSNGTAASNGTGIGSGIIFAAEDAAGQSELAAQIIGMLTTVTNTTEAGALAFRTRTGGGALTERMRITGTGNVGIGDATPDALLDFDFSSTSGSAGTEYGAFFTVTDTGGVQTGTDTTYGTRISTTRTGAGAGTLNTYGLYSDVTGDADGTSTAVAIYGTAAGADNNYAAILNGSVGINTTSPSHTLTVVGTLNVTGGHLNVVGLIVNATGSVGIGTASPGAELHVDGQVAIGSNLAGYTGVYDFVVSSANGGIVLDRTGGSNEPFIRLTAADAGGGQIRGLTGGGLRFTNSNSTSEKVRIDNNGLVGINATSPAALLHVDGTTDASLTTHGLAVFGSTTGANIVLDQNEIIARNNGANSILYLQIEGGNLFMGTSVAPGNVSIGSSGAATSRFQIGNDTNTQQWSGSNPYVLIQGVDNEVATPALTVKDENSGTMFELTTTGDSSVGRAYFGGLVGINTTAPQALLHINTSANVNPFRITSASSASTFIVDSSGSVGIGTASPVTALGVSGSVNVTGFVNATGIQSVNANITLDKGNLVLRNLGVANTTQERWLDGNGRVVAVRYWNGTALVLNVTG
ncbi:MAG: hypothetical protein J4469_05250, partial [Candidatus Aenigmarchaeota archaeon]|nr:hypothetical protein [Candidatus Aenigmarchaeota archaeon]